MKNIFVFANRTEAGRALAAKTVEKDFPNPVILALPRGGVPVGLEIAKALNAPLDLVLVRKIGVPQQPELALGAVVDGDNPDVVINESVRQLVGVSERDIETAKNHALKEIDRRRDLYLKHRKRVPISGTTAIVVDDGIATGATVRASLKALRRRNPKKLVLAIPVAPADTIAKLQSDVDEIICLQTPEPFFAIGYFYRDFGQIGDETVTTLLDAARQNLKEPRPK